MDALGFFGIRSLWERIPSCPYFPSLLNLAHENGNDNCEHGCFF